MGLEDFTIDDETEEEEIKEHLVDQLQELAEVKQEEAEILRMLSFKLEVRNYSIDELLDTYREKRDDIQIDALEEALEMVEGELNGS